jgi:hypothetical protein
VKIIKKKELLSLLSVISQHDNDKKIYNEIQSDLSLETNGNFKKIDKSIHSGVVYFE